MQPVLTDHEQAVLAAATARLVPGPGDDPAEAGHPGAREAGAAGYIITLLGAMDHRPPRVYAGGPYGDDKARFLPLNDAATAVWTARIRDLVSAYREGLARLDELSDGDFVSASPADQDAALATNPSGFTDLLFEQTIEGCYGPPEYGGNSGTDMWQSIGFPGDVQPQGYADDEVVESDGHDPYEPEPEGIVADVLRLFTATMRQRP